MRLYCQLPRSAIAISISRPRSLTIDNEWEKSVIPSKNESSIRYVCVKMEVVCMSE